MQWLISSLRRRTCFWMPNFFLSFTTWYVAASIFVRFGIAYSNTKQFPRELDARLGRSLSQAEVERFAREDPKIRRHLEVVRRKELLEHVLKEMESLRHLEAREKRYSSRGRDEGRKKGSWSLF